MLEIYAKVQNSNDASAESNRDSDYSDILLNFEKIADEATMIAFEVKLNDKNYRTDLINSLADSVGKNHRDKSHRNIALLFEPKIFGHPF